MEEGEKELPIPKILHGYIEADNLSKSVIVGGVSPKVNIEDMYAIFENFGPIMNIQVIKSIVFPQPANFYLIEFVNEDSCAASKYIEGTLLVDLPIAVYHSSTFVSGILIV